MTRSSIYQVVNPASNVVVWTDARIHRSARHLNLPEGHILVECRPSLRGLEYDLMTYPESWLVFSGMVALTGKEMREMIARSTAAQDRLAAAVSEVRYPAIPADDRVASFLADTQ